MEEKKNRRKFIGEAIKALVVSAIAIPTVATAKEKSKTVKMLTADGKLVEVDESVLNKASRKKANNKDIMNWIKAKS
ncbi:MAG TPA: hypothetical protein DIS90_12180 [Cytophagales bacterium]|nr:hypothetical protein [Cytophagales bacterium]HCR53674.1 hypothetical protein [Cytophagales bacterium]